MTGPFRVTASKAAVACLALLVCGAAAQQGHVTGPVAGYVFDRAALAMRPVLGVPGASIMGSPVSFPFELAAVAVSPAADSAVVTAADGSLHLVRLGGGTATEISYNGSSVRPDRVIYSPSGTSVALIAGGHAQIFSGLPAAATLVGTMDLGRAASAHVTAQSVRRPASMHASSMALSDDGAWLLAGEDGAVELIGAGGSHAIANAGRGALVAFAPGGHDVAFADPVGQSVTLVRDAAGAATQQLLWQDASIRGAAGLAFSTDAASLFLASGAGPAVTIFNLAAGAHAGLACDCTVTGLDRMGAAYRLNESGTGPLWLLDAAGNGPRTVFVPPAGSN